MYGVKLTCVWIYAILGKIRGISLLNTCKLITCYSEYYTPTNAQILYHVLV